MATYSPSLQFLDRPPSLNRKNPFVLINIIYCNIEASYHQKHADEQDWPISWHQWRLHSTLSSEVHSFLDLARLVSNWGNWGSLVRKKRSPKEHILPMRWQLLSSSRHVFTNFLNTSLQIFFHQYLSWKRKQIPYWSKKTFFLSLVSVWEN